MTIGIIPRSSNEHKKRRLLLLDQKQQLRIMKYSNERKLEWSYFTNLRFIKLEINNYM